MKYTFIHEIQTKISGIRAYYEEMQSPVNGVQNQLSSITQGFEFGQLRLPLPEQFV